MEGVFTDLISQFGYIGVWFLIFFENVFPPIPSELILPLSGSSLSSVICACESII